ncbi:MAG: hypothetical protein J0H14_27535, partial [Alphaproteobacteria bacterium]|nr:hypothetical protein [Alphaproteobacteria bacterium]
LIGAIVWGLSDSLERQRRFGWGEAWLAPMAEVLRGYLAHTLARFTALHASFLAGTLPAPRRRSAPRSAAEGAPGEAMVGRVRAPRRRPAIPRGPVFVEYGMRPYDLELGRLLDDPEIGPSSPPCRRPGGCCGRCGVGSPRNRCPTSCACRLRRVR